MPPKIIRNNYAYATDLMEKRATAAEQTMWEIFRGCPKDKTIAPLNGCPRGFGMKNGWEGT